MGVIVAIGMVMVIMSGGIDLSVGAVTAFSSVIAAYASPYGLSIGLLVKKGDPPALPGRH